MSIALRFFAVEAMSDITIDDSASDRRLNDCAEVEPKCRNQTTRGNTLQTERKTKDRKTPTLKIKKKKKKAKNKKGALHTAPTLRAERVQSVGLGGLIVLLSPFVPSSLPIPLPKNPTLSGCCAAGAPPRFAPPLPCLISAGSQGRGAVSAVSFVLSALHKWPLKVGRFVQDSCEICLGMRNCSY
ncbi:hypothetical protein ISCGN_021455 [Ixodes scapularis]